MKMKLFAALAALSLFAGCRTKPLFTCTNDVQCGPKGGCVAGGCAFASTDCPSGLRYDASAGGACVPVAPSDVDMSGLVDMPAPVGADLALDPDLSLPLDMTLTCANQGGPCTVGVGACAATGTIVCNPTPSCTAVAGAPNPGWHTAAAPNGSWDWNCDGAVWYQYPSGDTTQPPQDQPAIVDCADVGTQTVCGQDHWFYTYWNHWPSSCGHTVTDMICGWVTAGATAQCVDNGQQTVTQGCQ